MSECPKCGSSDTEVYKAERDDEPTILHCHECGSDTRWDTAGGDE
jgi:uncharacterized Zn finger protein